MRFFIVDDDPAIRSMLAQIIEDADLGEICGEAEDGTTIDLDFLEWKRVDILLIDLLMPNRDGLETVRHLRGYQGKIVMLSQIETKEMIAEAYSHGIEYYVTKPINRLEVISVLQKVKERLLLQQSIEGIQRSLSVLSGHAQPVKKGPESDSSFFASAKFLLTELGMISENGSKDLLAMMDYLHHWEKSNSGHSRFPSLKEIFMSVATEKLNTTNTAAINKEVKAAEQRVRRAIYQALTHLASLGLTDYSNPKFESYAATFFDFVEVRKRMMELESKKDNGMSNAKINTKKFIFVLYIEAKRRTEI
ncbi:response regulator [Brevibacillus panacihumi]|uniref:Response regulator n=1 Tax=Brevibacillus panacihumi TaxID=497735 RepID=A0A3M8CRJ2_9BACL|nr:response regulator [Brevibacillus panacihumi]RNB78169.1 response regulator [Brevibacillus panacihumi]